MIPNNSQKHARLQIPKKFAKDNFLMLSEKTTTAGITNPNDVVNPEKDKQVANPEKDKQVAKQTDAKQVSKKVSKPKKETAKFNFEFANVSKSCIEFKAARRLWFYKTSDKNLANLLDIDIDKLDKVLESDKYFQSLQNLFCVQWDNEDDFLKWTQSFPRPGINIVLSQRLKVDKAMIPKFVETAKKHYALISKGGKSKVKFGQVANPRRIGNNNRNGNSS